MLLKEKVRINAVAPTAIKTEFIEKFLATTADPDAAMKEIDKANPTSLHHGDMPTESADLCQSLAKNHRNRNQR